MDRWMNEWMNEWTNLPNAHSQVWLELKLETKWAWWQTPCCFHYSSLQPVPHCLKLLWRTRGGQVLWPKGIGSISLLQVVNHTILKYHHEIKCDKCMGIVSWFVLASSVFEYLWDSLMKEVFSFLLLNLSLLGPSWIQRCYVLHKITCKLWFKLEGPMSKFCAHSVISCTCSLGQSYYVETTLRRQVVKKNFGLSFLALEENLQT